jgi:hypothetical protein
MQRQTAGRELVGRLVQVGVRSGGIDLPVIWPVVASWWRAPVSDVPPEDDERAFYLSLAPAAADPRLTTVFAGTAPMGISTPHLDSFADGRQIDRLIADLESSAVFEIASAPALSLLCSLAMGSRTSSCQRGPPCDSQSPWLAPRQGGHLGSTKLVEHQGGRDARCGARSG